jgi:hypothetical protein
MHIANEAFCLRSHSLTRTFSLLGCRRLEKTKGTNKADLKDDVWVVFATLINRLQTLLFRWDLCVFPQVSEIKTETCRIGITPVPELVILAGSPCLKSEFYSETKFTTSRYIGVSAECERYY